MANMCVAYSHAVNGVSQLHGEILKHTTFADYYSIMPEKFYAITNGHHAAPLADAGQPGALRAAG